MAEVSLPAEKWATLRPLVQACWLRTATIRKRWRQQNGQERERAAGRLDRVRVARDKGKIPQFQIGEFVLVAAPVARAKFRVKWMGSYRIAETLNDYVYVVEDVVTARRKSVHVQR